MSADVPTTLRELVFERAQGRCEYCLIPERAGAFRHEPDHILPVQHDGKTEAGNLALACIRCNRAKGPNVGSFDPETGALVPFFNPRTHTWQDHFHLAGAIIHPLTPHARVTVKILRLNDATRIDERERLIAIGLYP